VDIVKRIIIIEGILGGVEQQENPKNLLSKIAGITGGKAGLSDFEDFQLYTDTDFIFAAKERNHDKFIKSISSKDSLKYDGLRMASKFGDKELVLFLIKNGADVNDKNHGYTALQMACHGGHLEIVRLLIDNGADVNTINKNGETAVMIASGRGHTGIAEFLKQAGAGVPLNDNTK
jgi:ankyrin repeat protein